MLKLKNRRRLSDGVSHASLRRLLFIQLLETGGAVRLDA